MIMFIILIEIYKYRTKHTFNFNISGIVVGNYEEVDYSNLYIEDINYITNAIITYKLYRINIKI